MLCCGALWSVVKCCEVLRDVAVTINFKNVAARASFLLRFRAQGMQHQPLFLSLSHAIVEGYGCDAVKVVI